MVLIGASHNYDGAENTNLKDIPSYEELPAPFVEHLKAIHQGGETQIKALFNPDLKYQIKLGEEEMSRISSRTLIVNGDSDEILGTASAIDLHEKLSDSDLWIVPNTGHIAITGPNMDDFLKKSVQFFEME